MSQLFDHMATRKITYDRQRSKRGKEKGSKGTALLLPERKQGEPSPCFRQKGGS
ncbi:hypothetical protein Desgi_2135 [Desulfoscipio gibsoniae DSM 7213]|uniref:Uncharacterized protein n=1 Tax=Desulfoscipio gibsoniae DSM 7213 TaxID=767817 RepID=R4KEG2_9FIRM|nr:hypothetical protein Desgi_2135 [Desulfoscipio gibsoniae DSM 7213]